MPQFKQTFSLPEVEKGELFVKTFQTFQNLGWPVLYAGEDQLVGATPKNWKSKGQQILIEIGSGELIVQSKMVNGESFDISGINKKNVERFFGILQYTFQHISAEEEAGAAIKIVQLKKDTIIAAENEIKEAELVDKAMNLSGSNLYFTYGIIAINIIVFILMALDGAGIMDANGLVHIKWGSNFAPLTLSGDYWRLITNTFIHFGIIHLLMNMYCLYTIGVYLEPMLGKVKYITAYLATGILASIVSLWWHKDPANSAGASGAIFGMYGLFLALLTTDLIPKTVRSALLQSIGIFVVYNLVYGMKSGVDNSAHVGGLVSGFIFGYLYVIAIRAEKKELKANWVVPVVIISTLGISFAFIDQHKASSSEREKILAEVKAGSHKNDEQFSENYKKFIEAQDIALKVLNDTSLSNDGMKKSLNEISLPEWKKAEMFMKSTLALDINPVNRKRTELALQYISFRKQEVNVAFKVLDHAEGGTAELEMVRSRIDSVTTQLKQN